jgi:hypothetical protein
MYLVTIILVIITILILEDDCGCNDLTNNQIKTFTIDHSTPKSFSFGRAGTILIPHDDSSENMAHITERTTSTRSSQSKTYELFNPETVCQDKFIMRDKKLSRNQALSSILASRESDKKSRLNEKANWVRISGNTRIYGYNEELDGRV